MKFEIRPQNGHAASESLYVIDCIIAGEVVLTYTATSSELAASLLKG